MVLKNKYYSIFGFNLYGGSRDSVLEWIDDGKSKSFKYIVTPNVNHVIRHDSSEIFREYYESAGLILCDSRVLNFFFSKLFKIDIDEVIPGSDLTQAIFDKVLVAGDTIAVVGGEQETIQELRNRLNGISIHHINPPMGYDKSPDEVRKVIDWSRSINFDYIFFATGSPRQEKLAYLLSKESGITGIGFCIGASILFYVGTVTRAPVWLQKMGLEWLYRIYAEPRRLLMRYVGDSFQIIPVIAKEFFRNK